MIATSYWFIERYTVQCRPLTMIRSTAALSCPGDALHVNPTLPVYLNRAVWPEVSLIMQHLLSVKTRFEQQKVNTMCVFCRSMQDL